jgi:NAD+ diphosphatase
MKRESIYKRYIPSVTPENENYDYSWWFIFYSNKLLVKITDNSFTIPYEKCLDKLNISPVRIQYFGTLSGKSCYAVEVDSDNLDNNEMSFMNLRSLFERLDEDILLVAGKAYQIVIWNQTHQYCGRCGSETENLKNEMAKICPKCGFISYPRICPVTITAIIKDNKLLLAHNKSFLNNMYSIISGFVEAGETLEECVQREAFEEIGIKIKNIKYFSSQPWPFPNSLMTGFTAEYDSGTISVDGTEIDDAGWFSADDLPKIPGKMSISRQLIDWFIGNFQNK